MAGRRLEWSGIGSATEGRRRRRTRRAGISLATCSAVLRAIKPRKSATCGRSRLEEMISSFLEHGVSCRPKVLNATRNVSSS